MQSNLRNNLAKKLAKEHPNVYSILSKVYRLYIRFCYILLVPKVAICKKVFSHSQKLMVNIGGGIWYKRNWKVLDFQSEWYSYNRLFIDYDYDLTKREKMPFEDNSVDLFYSEHTFEHVSDRDCEHVLAEMYRCLKPGGAVRIVVPDMDLAYTKYANADEKFFEVWIKTHKATLTEAFMIIFARPKRNECEESIRRRFENLEKGEFFNFYTKDLRQDPKYAGYHINWFIYSKLERMLKEAGFQKVYKSTSQGSRFQEMRGKGFDTRPSWSLHVEAIK